MEKELYQDLIGLPYNEDSSKGFNCWSFVKEVASRVNILLPEYDVPKTTKDLNELVYNEKVKYQKLSSPESHCLVLFRIFRIKHLGLGWHVGFVLNTTQFIHCTKASGVCVTRLSHPFYYPIREGFYKCK